MKQILMCAVLSAMAFSGCKKDESAMDAIQVSQSSNEIHQTPFRAALAGESEVPTHSSNASGTFNATYSDRKLSYTLTYSVVSGTTFQPTVAHIHKGLPGVDGNANIVFDLGAIRSEITSGQITLTPALLSDLKSGLYYVHMHSQIFPEGDIRGQIVSK